MITGVIITQFVYKEEARSDKISRASYPVQNEGGLVVSRFRYQTKIWYRK